MLTLLLTAVPWGVGYASGSYWAALILGALLCAAALEWARRGASGADEVDVWPGVLTILCAVAVLLCLAGARLGRVRRRWARRAIPRCGTTSSAPTSPAGVPTG